MTITLDLPPEIEARLTDEARMKDVAASDVVKAYLIHDHPQGGAAVLSPAEFDKGVDELFDGLGAPEGVRGGFPSRELVSMSLCLADTNALPKSGATGIKLWAARASAHRPSRAPFSRRRCDD